VEISHGISLLELKKKLGVAEKQLVPVVGALYNNRIMGLEYKLKRNCKIRFLTTESDEGLSIYSQSLSALLLTFPQVHEPERLPEAIEQRTLFQIYSEQRGRPAHISLRGGGRYYV